MSLCNVCARPGYCCNGFRLTYKDGLYKEPSLELANARMKREGKPFKAVGHFWNGAVKFSCPLLDENGRCGDYENRPETCRMFEPTSDNLCVYFQRIDQSEHDYFGEGVS